MLKNKKGITLVELLIVVVILGIIAAISIPAVGNVVQNAQKDAVLADATNLRSAANLCVTSGDCDFSATSGNNVGRFVIDEDPDPDEENGVYVVFGSGQLENYIEIDVEEYLVIYKDSAFFAVAIQTEVEGGWVFIGDPRDATRTNVVTFGDFDGTFPSGAETDLENWEFTPQD